MAWLDEHQPRSRACYVGPLQSVVAREQRGCSLQVGPACQDYANGPTIWRGPVRSDPSRENLCGQEASVQSHDMMQKCCSQKLVFSCSRFLCFLFFFISSLWRFPNRIRIGFVELILAWVLLCFHGHCRTNISRWCVHTNKRRSGVKRSKGYTIFL